MSLKLKQWIKMRRPPLSLARRLTILITLVIVLIFMLLGVFIVRSISNHFVEWDRLELQTVVNDIEEIIQSNIEQDNIIKEIQALDLREPSINIELRQHNHVIYQSDDSSFEEIPIPTVAKIHSSAKLTSLMKLAVGSETYRIGCVVLQSKTEAPYLLRLTIPTMFHAHYIKGLIQSLWWLMVIACVLVVLVVRIAIHQGHKPLRTMSQTLQMITSENLHTRIDAGKYPVELQQWCQSFNHMIERIEFLFQQQSNFSADIAHELRTPITALITQTEIALKQQRAAPEYQETLYSQLEELEHLGRMVGDMLFLARMDSQSLNLHKIPMNLYDEITDVFEYFEPLMEEKLIASDISDVDITINGDRALLRRAFSNLIGNAIRYTPDGGKITCEIEEMGSGTSIKLINTGVTIPVKHLDNIFDRFYRIDPARQRNNVEGTGIGLSIVKSIIEVHGAKITVDSENQVTIFTIVGL